MHFGVIYRRFYAAPAQSSGPRWNAIAKLASQPQARVVIARSSQWPEVEQNVTVIVAYCLVLYIMAGIQNLWCTLQK